MKVCVISGVTRQQGLGYAIARRMYANDYLVYIGGRSLGNAVELAAMIDPSGSRVKALPLDVTRETSVEAFFSAIRTEQTKLDALINNAGAGFDAGAQPLATDFEDTRTTFETNLFGAWRMVRHAVPMMSLSDSPCIVNVSSGAGSFADPVFGLANHPAGVPSYALSKLALNGLTVKLARQLEKDGIIVNAVDPGLVATYPGMEKMGAADPMDAASGIVWAATLPKGGPSGRFFRDGKEIGW